jgi:hypothetical protein
MTGAVHPAGVVFGYRGEPTKPEALFPAASRAYFCWQTLLLLHAESAWLFLTNFSRNHDKPVPVRVKTNKPNGRPTKKTAQSVARILKIARDGLPLKFAAQAGNIDFDTLSQWRAKDPVFARALEQAQLESVEKRWKTIARAAEDRVSANGEVRPGDWKAVAWQLERSFPSEFSRPEIQLGVQINNNQTINNTLVVTAEVADQLQSRAERADANIEKLFRERKVAQTNSGNGDGVREMETTTALVAAAITMPQGEPSQAWWSQLTGGDSSRAIEKKTAIWIVRRVLAELVGGQKAKTASIDFDESEGPVTISDLIAFLDEQTAGPIGQQTLRRLAGRG